MFQLNSHNYAPRSDCEDPRSIPLWPTSQPKTHGGGNDEPTKAEILLELGILYWRRGNFDRSEQLLNKAREASEDSNNIRFLAQCFIGLALVKNSLEKADDAINAYQQAIAITPDNFHLQNNLGNLYLKTNQFEGAFAAFKKTLQINPNDIVAWVGLANIYTQYRQYQKAINAYQKVLTLDPENVEVWAEIGALYTKSEAYEEAIETLSRVLERNPKDGQAHLNLAIALTKIGRHKDSVPHFLESIELLENRNDKECALELMENAVRTVRRFRTVRPAKNPSDNRMDPRSQGDVTWFYYKYNEEITSFNISSSASDLKRLAKETAKKFTNNQIGTSNAQQTDKGERDMPNILPLSSIRHSQEEKQSAYIQDIECESTDPSVWNELGNYHFNNQAYEDAIAAYTRAIEIDPAYGQPYNNLALIHFMLGNYVEAIVQYQNCIKLLNTDQEKAIAWNGLGNVYRCIKDYESAQVAYQNASELDKANGGVYDNAISYEVSDKDKTADFWNDLGKLFFKTGAYDKAASAFQEAIRLEPSSGDSYCHLARALTAQGQYEEAVSLYHKSIDLIPNNKDKASAWNRLGDVHRKLNDYDNARKAYQNGTALANNELSLLNRTRFSLLSNCAAKG